MRSEIAASGRLPPVSRGSKLRFGHVDAELGVGGSVAGVLVCEQRADAAGHG